MDGLPLRKMISGRDGNGKVEYALHLADRTWPMADFLGRPFTLRFTGARTCLACRKRVRKFYGQGLCFNCLRDAPEASPCIVRPELCRGHLGEGRDLEWERDHHVQEHVVYLSQTGRAGPDGEGIKVGVTRSTQLHTRWIDQGAVLAVEIARVPYRQLAGALEVDLKRVFADRTAYRAMLRVVQPDATALERARALAFAEAAPELRPYLLPDAPLTELVYPMEQDMPKVATVSLERVPEVSGTLVGIKGQYLYWGDGRVLNVRSHSGFHVDEELFSVPS